MIGKQCFLIIYKLFVQCKEITSQNSASKRSDRSITDKPLCNRYLGQVIFTYDCRILICLLVAVYLQRELPDSIRTMIEYHSMPSLDKAVGRQCNRFPH